MNTWIVGVDLRHRSDGAVRFGAWLREQSGGAVQLVGVHVAPSAALDELAGLDGRTRVAERLRAEAELATDRAGARGNFSAVELTEAEVPADALASARALRAADGMIVGRKAASDGRDLVRLGSVARKLLQRLVAPTFVVPPDLRPDMLGAGPVVVAVTPGESSVGAVKLGAALATMLRRPLLFVRVVSVPEEYTQIYWSVDALTEFRGQTVQAAQDRTGEWLAGQGRAEPLVVRYGDAVTEILAVAGEQQAPLIVCGSRMLSRAERIIALSISSELAARAAVPVLVVPPDAGA